MIEEGPFRVSRNPLYVGLLALYLGMALLAPTFWGLLLLPAAAWLPLWGAIRPEERYLAFLSLKFLLPKLVDEKVLILRRYENVLRNLPPDAPPEVAALLRAHQAECREQLEVLKRASEEVIAASRK